MSTAESQSGTSAEPEPSPSPSPPAAVAEPQREEETPTTSSGDDGWFDRIKGLLGFGGSETLRESIEDALARDEQEHHQFTPEERLLLRNILRLREVRIDDVMVPRADIDAVEEQTALADIIVMFRESGHSRMPVYRETLDDPRGMVHIKDLMALITERMIETPQPLADDEAAPGRDKGESGTAPQAPFDLCAVDLSQPLAETRLIRPVLFVPPSMPAPDLMAKMQATRIQMALVIDEYGGTDGLASLEDLVETVVGDIEDEHDEDDEPVVSLTADGVWTADARVALEDAQPVLGPEFDIGELGEEVDTLGGLLFTLIGRIPVRGELIASDELPGFEFEVLDADPRRIKKLRIFRRRDARSVESRRRLRTVGGTDSGDAAEASEKD
ncbi:MAG: hypothetical protein C0606_07470 [Hyphomicrobiales bacterium]|nr:MAG: hypothetical protein C0606_07470 [Hyphomicrobiales bacterium]